jgi:hypothetical protein
MFDSILVLDKCIFSFLAAALGHNEIKIWKAFGTLLWLFYWKKGPQKDE